MKLDTLKQSTNHKRVTIQSSTLIDNKCYNGLFNNINTILRIILYSL